MSSSNSAGSSSTLPPQAPEPPSSTKTNPSIAAGTSCKVTKVSDGDTLSLHQLPEYACAPNLV
ncbi:MAG: hypothetical protein LBP35_06580 [Candidatus Ancillula trichonymphae]|nr:hypothetical protein [Candidatus Ancillula trichonymphae]